MIMAMMIACLNVKLHSFLLIHSQENRKLGCRKCGKYNYASLSLILFGSISKQIIMLTRNWLTSEEHLDKVHKQTIDQNILFISNKRQNRRSYMVCCTAEKATDECIRQ